jgi:hypothetical protein
LRDLAGSNDEEDGEDENNDKEDSELGKLSEDDKPSWVMGTKSNNIQHRVERFQQKQMTRDKLTQPGWGDTADYFCEGDKMYSTAELRVSADVKLQTDQDVAAPAITPFEEGMECTGVVSGRSQMPSATSRPGIRHTRLGSGKPQ